MKDQAPCKQSLCTCGLVHGAGDHNVQGKIAIAMQTILCKGIGLLVERLLADLVPGDAGGCELALDHW